MPVTLPETIVRRRCAALIPYARNARTHSDQQVTQIAASIREFGFTNPVLIDEEDGIIVGHGRVLAAHLLGLDEVPCIVLAFDDRGGRAQRDRPPSRGCAVDCPVDVKATGECRVELAIAGRDDRQRSGDVAVRGSRHQARPSASRRARLG